MGCLFGIIVSFLVASILNIANGVPFLLLQTTWMNFTVILSHAIGLGYGQPSPHLMEGLPAPEYPGRATDDDDLAGRHRLVMGTVN